MESKRSTEKSGILVCPSDGQSLEYATRKEAENEIGRKLTPLRKWNVESGEGKPIGATDRILVREDWEVAYPVVKGHPCLLFPEALTEEGKTMSIDLEDPKYEEAYEEMSFYNEVGFDRAERIEETDIYDIVAPAIGASEEEKRSFPDPKEIWIDAVYDCAAQWDSFQHLSPVEGKRLMQLGGSGTHAVKFLLAGASECWVVTPMLGEAECAQALAESAGVEEGLHCVVSVAEELPFRGNTFDGIYSGGSLHHMRTDQAVPEIVRILAPEGKFAAADPYRTPVYALGTALFGKRETDVYCRPMTENRIAPIRKYFSQSEVIHHGTLTRYPLLALSKFGIESSLSFAWNANKVDDLVSSVVPGSERWGSSVCMLGVK